MIVKHDIFLEMTVLLKFKCEVGYSSHKSAVSPSINV